MDTIALFPLSSVLFPGATMQLHLFEPRYLKMMEERAELDPMFGVVLTKEGWEVGDQPMIFETGTAASLAAGVQHADGRYTIAVHGGRRFRVLDQDWSNEYLIASVEWFADDHDPPAALVQRVTDSFGAYLVALARDLGDREAEERLPQALDDVLDPNERFRVFQIASQLPLNTWQRQQLLDITSTSSIWNEVGTIIKRELKMLELAGPTVTPRQSPRTTFSPN